MRESFERADGKLIVGTGVIAADKGYNAIIKKIQFCGTFVGLFELRYFPFPPQYMDCDVDDHFCVNKKKLPSDAKCGDWIMFVGRIKKYDRKDGTTDFAINKFISIQKITIEEVWYPRVRQFLCYWNVYNRPECDECRVQNVVDSAYHYFTNIQPRINSCDRPSLYEWFYPKINIDTHQCDHFQQQFKEIINAIKTDDKEYKENSLFFYLVQKTHDDIKNRQHKENATPNSKNRHKAEELFGTGMMSLADARNGFIISDLI